jgi:hypothetical protein
MGKLTYEECKSAASKCESRMEFRTKFQKAYLCSLENGWVDGFFKKIKRDNHYLDVYENCLNEAKCYNSLSEIRHADTTLYNRIYSNKWHDRINEDMGWEKYKRVKKRKGNAVHANTLQKRVDDFIKTCKEIYDNNEFDYSRVHENFETDKKKVLILHNLPNGSVKELWRTPCNHKKCLKKKALSHEGMGKN